ncbi:MAG TPA: dienelactone hydrolase family protein [Novosphingobium sp.]
MSSLERIPYDDMGTSLVGWLARPVVSARGAVLVCPTIVNASPPIERRAQMLADMGYIALIADFYGEPVPSFEAAGALSQTLRADPHAYRRRLRAGLSALRETAGKIPIAVIGYCMGGGAALELARDSANIVAAVSFHGLLETSLPAQPGAIKARLLVCHGDADPMVPRDHVLAFWNEMDTAGAQWHFHAYSGVKHGFTDPGSDARGLPAIAYDASADRQSWAAMLELFEELFQA